MKSRIILLVLILCSVSCEKMEGCVELGGGYRLWIVSANEKFITREDDVYWLGPRIESMALVDDYIVGNNPQFEWNNLKNTPGFFVINTKTKMADLGLQIDEFNKKLNSVTTNKIELEGVSEIFRKRKAFLCN